MFHQFVIDLLPGLSDIADPGTIAHKPGCGSRNLAHHLAPALAVVATLIVVARPLTVIICLAVDRRGDWSKEEVIFLAWTRETGVLPAALAGIVVGLHVPDADLVVTVVALAIVVTLGVQTTTKHWLARRLRLLEAGVSPP